VLEDSNHLDDVFDDEEELPEEELADEGALAAEEQRRYWLPGEEETISRWMMTKPAKVNWPRQQPGPSRRRRPPQARTTSQVLKPTTISPAPLSEDRAPRPANHWLLHAMALT